MSALICIHGPNRGEYFNLPGRKPLVVGREGSLLFHLADRRVSRKHTEFTCEGDRQHCLVKDLGSNNGTHVNGERIEHAVEIKDGDLIRMGYTLLVFLNKELDQNSPIPPFLKACEKLYAKHLTEVRMHDHSAAPQPDMSDTMRSNTMFGRRFSKSRAAS
ncbi:MAG: FHA domain-containing protein [Planctomycetota bacterium]